MPKIGEIMLRTVNDLDGFVVEATDGRIGELVDFYIDDEFWTVRFLVVRTDAWLAGRKVLISPQVIARTDGPAKVLAVSLTREQVRKSPDIDTCKPVARQHEVENYGYYVYPFHWGESGLWGNFSLPTLMLALHRGGAAVPLTVTQEQLVQAHSAFHRERGDDPHLRSCRSTSGYHVQASDGGMGHVDSFVVDDESWAIRYLIVDTSDWWMGHQVLIAPARITDISWLEATVSLNMTRQAIQDAPRYDGKTLPRLASA